MGKKYGYIRVSTQGQAQNGNGLKSQREAVVNRGAEKVFEDVWTGTKRDRPELSKLMDLLKCGDTLIVTKLDRVARSVVDGCTLIETLMNRGVTIDVLDMAVFDSRRTSVLQLHVLLAFAQFERDLLLEGLQEGKAVAREKEGYREGRKPKWTSKQYDHAMELLQHNAKLYFDTHTANDQIITKEKGHGRFEVREYYLVTDVDWMWQKPEWEALGAIGMVKSKITRNGKLHEETRYVITTLTDINTFAKAVRAHWGIENSLHWYLDVIFNEDASRTRKDNSAENFSVIRRIALNILKKFPADNMSLNRKRRKCHYDADFMAEVLLSVV